MSTMQNKALIIGDVTLTLKFVLQAPATDAAEQKDEAAE